MMGKLNFIPRHTQTSPRHLAAIIALLGLCLVSGCTGQPDDTEATSGPTPPSLDCQVIPDESSGATEPVEGPGGDPVDVVESGQSYIEVDHGTRIIYGATIRNTSELVAKDVTVEVAGYNDDEVVYFVMSAVPYLIPDQIHGVGGEATHNKDRMAEFDRIEVSFDVAEWWPVSSEIFQPNEVIAFDAEFSDAAATEYVNREDADLIRFSAYSCYPDERDLLGVAVIRDASGGVIGGTFLTDTGPCSETSMSAREAIPGWHPSYCLFNRASASSGLDDFFDLAAGEITPEVHLYADATVETGDANG